MKVAGSNQSVILASDYKGPGKLSSVFDAALGPAGTREAPPRLIIVAPHSGSPISESSEPRVDTASAGSPFDKSLVARPSSADATPVRALQASIQRFSAAYYRKPVDLYTQTQRILVDTASRAVYLDVHA